MGKVIIHDGFEGQEEFEIERDIPSVIKEVKVINSPYNGKVFVILSIEEKRNFEDLYEALDGNINGKTIKGRNNTYIIEYDKDVPQKEAFINYAKEILNEVLDKVNSINHVNVKTEVQEEVSDMMGGKKKKKGGKKKKK